MVPFRILFNPVSISRSYPVREWRRVTVWLKWGLLLPFLAIIIRIFLAPGESSSILRLFAYFAEESEFAIPPIVRYGLFMIMEGIILIVVWLARGGIIFMFYRLVSPSFSEGKIALSIAGASLITGIWYLIPYGYFPAIIHCAALTSYLLVQINRTELKFTLPVSILAALIPLLF